MNVTVIDKICRWYGQPRPATRQVLAVLLAGALTQLILTFRGDSAAHVIGGGALVMCLGSLIPRSWIRARPALVECAIFAAVLGAAWVGEMTIFGPFDLDDVAFTIAGGFVALAALSKSATPRRVRENAHADHPVVPPAVPRGGNGR